MNNPSGSVGDLPENFMEETGSENSSISPTKLSECGSAASIAAAVTCNDMLQNDNDQPPSIYAQPVLAALTPLSVQPVSSSIFLASPTNNSNSLTMSTLLSTPSCFQNYLAVKLEPQDLAMCNNNTENTGIQSSASTVALASLAPLNLPSTCGSSSSDMIQLQPMNCFATVPSTTVAPLSNNSSLSYLKLDFQPSNINNDNVQPHSSLHVQSIPAATLIFPAKSQPEFFNGSSNNSIHNVTVAMIKQEMLSGLGIGSGQHKLSSIDDTLASIVNNACSSTASLSSANQIVDAGTDMYFSDLFQSDDDKNNHVSNDDVVSSLLSLNPPLNGSGVLLRTPGEPSLGSLKRRHDSKTDIISGIPSFDDSDSAEFDIYIDTKELCNRIAYELKAHSIPQAVFAERVLCRSQGTLSDLLRNPKPWNKLKSGRETFRRMYTWLKQPLPQRLASLELWKVGMQTTAAASEKQLTDDEPLSGSGEDDLSPMPMEDNRQAKTNSGNQRIVKKPRLVFTDIQKRTLQAIFKETQRPSKEMQQTIAEHLGLDLSTVQNFFMNARRRCRDRFAESNTDRPAPHQSVHEVSPPPENSCCTDQLISTNSAVDSLQNQRQPNLQHHLQPPVFEATTTTNLHENSDHAETPPLIAGQRSGNNNLQSIGERQLQQAPSVQRIPLPPLCGIRPGQALPSFGDAMQLSIVNNSPSTSNSVLTGNSASMLPPLRLQTRASDRHEINSDLEDPSTIDDIINCVIDGNSNTDCNNKNLLPLPPLHHIRTAGTLPAASSLAAKRRSPRKPTHFRNSQGTVFKSQPTLLPSTAVCCATVIPTVDTLSFAAGQQTVLISGCSDVTAIDPYLVSLKLKSSQVVNNTNMYEVLPNVSTVGKRASLSSPGYSSSDATLSEPEAESVINRFLQNVPTTEAMASEFGLKAQRRGTGDNSCKQQQLLNDNEKCSAHLHSVTDGFH